MMKAVSACACQFCEEFANLAEAPSRILWEDSDFVLLPTIGAVTPGYVLLMPKQHITSFADLTLSELRTALDVAEQARAAISAQFGPTILAEHGPGQPGTMSAACCDHAHWHLIPCDPYRVAHTYEHVGGAPITLSNIEELCQWTEQAYLFLSPLKHVYWVWPYSNAFGSQFVRKVCAKILGIEELYDWAVFPFTENMLVTRSKLEQVFQQSLGMGN